VTTIAGLALTIRPCCQSDHQAPERDEQILFDQDPLKARAAMERAWLEAKPVRERQ